MCFALLSDNTLHASVTDDTIQYLNIFRAHSVMHIFTELGNVCDKVQFVGRESQFCWHSVKDAEK